MATAPTSPDDGPMFTTARGQDLQALLDDARDMARTQRAAAEAEEVMGPFQVQQASANFPEFNSSEPDVWFSQLEIFFKFAGVRKDGAKLYNVLHRLPKAIFSRIVIDLSDNMPAEKQYEWVKKLLCKIYGKSDTTKAEMILNLRQLGTSHPNALLNEVRGLIPASHRIHECSSCGHVDNLPPCPIAYTQYRTCLPPAVRRELPPVPANWGEVARDVEESWEANTSLQGNAVANAVQQEWPGALEQATPNFFQPNQPAFAPTPAMYGQPGPSVAYAWPPANTPPVPMVFQPENSFPIAAAHFKQTNPQTRAGQVKGIDPRPLICQYHAAYGDQALYCQVGCGYKQGNPQSAPKGNQTKKKKPQPKERVGPSGRKKHYNSEN